jgi:hypothetical protein
MPLKTFKDADGTTWSVWRIDATVGRDVRGMPRRWLVFQDEPGTERRRLVEFPDHWESLSDEGLAQLCRAATPGKEWGRPSPPGGMSQLDEFADRKSDD